VLGLLSPKFLFKGLFSVEVYIPNLGTDGFLLFFVYLICDFLSYILFGDWLFSLFTYS